MFRRTWPVTGTIARIARWGMELIVVAIGVLLALWAQAWFEGRKDAEARRDTIREMDVLIGRALVQTAARVSSDLCSRRRIAELDGALRSSAGQWSASALPGLPGGMVVGHFPAVYLMDADVLPLQVFDTARRNGTLKALAPRDRRFYEQVERELHWLNDVWVGSTDPAMRLAVLGVDGPLGENARDEMRQALAWLDGENRVTILRARSLARLAREHGFALAAGDLEDYRRKIERDRRLFGDCVVEVDPLRLTPYPEATSSR